MACIRHLIMRFHGLAFLLALCAFAVKIAVPAGYMLSNGPQGLILQICSGMVAGQPVSGADQASMQMQAAMGHAMSGGEHMHAERGDHSQDRHADDSHAQQQCPYTALSIASLAGADIDLLLAAIAFVMLLWLRPLPPMAIRRALRWQPPSRAPPLPA